MTMFTTEPKSSISSREKALEKKDVASAQGKLSARDVSIYYGSTAAIRNVTLEIPERKVTAIIGPSGCGKSTLLRAFNRMNELVGDVRLTGQVLLEETDIYAPGVDPVEVRRRIGMVFQKPNPFPKTIYKNVAWGPKINGYRGNMDELVEDCLRRAALWDEVKDKLNKSGLELSGGQQQRLCIARALATRPEVLLLDEPASALDPISTACIEELLDQLKNELTIAIVTHNMQQAARVSDHTAFLYVGELVEFGATEQLFTKPKLKRTEDYITGRFG